MDAHHIETRGGEINYQNRRGRETTLRRAGGRGRGERATREFFSEYLAAPVRNRVSNYCNALTLSREKGWGCHFFFFSALALMRKARRQVCASMLNVSDVSTGKD